MSVFAKNDNSDDLKTEQLVSEINSLLEKMKVPPATQTGGTTNIISDINHLLSEYNGTNANYNQEELESMELLGGAAKKKKTVAKTRGSKSKSKAASKSKSKKGEGKKVTRVKKEKVARVSKKGKVARVSKKTKSKSMEKPKMKRELNPAMRASIDLKAFIKEKVGATRNLNNVAAMSKVAWKILKENSTDLEKSKKAFKVESFLKDYDAAVKEVERNRAEKKQANAKA